MTQIEFDQAQLLDLAAQKLADGYRDEGELYDRADSIIRKRIDDLFKEKINDLVDAALTSKLEEVMNQTIQPVDIFGDKTGEPTTIKGALVDKAKDFWNTKVDSNGKPIDKERYYSRNSTKTRAEWLLGRIVSEEFASQVKANATQITGAFKEAMAKDAHDMIDKHINALIKTKVR